MTDTLTTLTARDRRARAARSYGAGTVEGSRAAALMRMAAEAAKIAAAPIKPRPDWARLEDAAAQAVEDAFRAFGTDAASVVLARTGQNPRNPAALAAATGSAVHPDHTLIASCRRFLEGERDRDRRDRAALADDYAGPGADLDTRAEARRAANERGKQIVDPTAPPLDADTLAAIDEGFPGHRRAAVRVALVAALARDASPNIAAACGITPAAVRQNVKRGTAALARLIRAGNADTLAALDRVVAADGSGHRSPRDLIAALMDSTTPTGERGSRAGNRAPRNPGSPAAALKRARDAEPPEPWHFRFAHNRDARRRPPQRRPFIGPQPQPIPTTVAQQAERAAHTRRSSLKIKEAICTA